MKKITKILTLLMPLTLVPLTGCNSNQEETIPPPVEETTKDVAVYMGLFETKEYTPDKRLRFEVNFPSNSIAVYENGCFTTNINEGSVVAVFSSPSFTYNVTLSVIKDATVPNFSIENQDLSIYKGTTYELDTFLSYKGVDANQYDHEISVSKETDNGSSSISVSGNSLSINGLNEGSDTYTVYTEFVGFTLSKTLAVTTKINNSLVVCGKNLTYNNDGPFYSISLYKYNENRINLEEDLTVLKAGEEVAYGDLDIAFNNVEVLDIESGYLVPKKAGNASFTITFGLESLEVYAEIIKPVLSNNSISVEDKKFDLDMTISSTSILREFTPSNNVKKVSIQSDASYIEVSKIVVENEEINFTSDDANYDIANKELNISASIFKVENYGRQLLTVSLATAEYIDTYTFSLDFITKYISTWSELDNCFTQKFAADVIIGQYVLANDIDANGSLATGSYVANATPINYATGFRGIFDGGGYSIKNYNSTMYGFFFIIGNGAIIKNLVLDNVHYNSKSEDGDRGNMVLGRFISGATFINVAINLASDSVTHLGTGGTLDSTGLVTTEVFTYNVVNGFTVNAQGFDMISIFGKQIPGTTFYDVVINCKSLAYIGSNNTALEGVTINLD